jgi:pyrimidine deaminase RibD-like protein
VDEDKLQGEGRGRGKGGGHAESLAVSCEYDVRIKEVNQERNLAVYKRECSTEARRTLVHDAALEPCSHAVKLGRVTQAGAAG